MSLVYRLLSFYFSFCLYSLFLSIFPINERFISCHVLSSFRQLYDRSVFRFLRSSLFHQSTPRIYKTIYKFSSHLHINKTYILHYKTQQTIIIMLGIGKKSIHSSMGTVYLFLFILIVNQFLIAHSFRLMHDDTDQVQIFLVFYYTTFTIYI